jgi:hypothetical protein
MVRGALWLVQEIGEGNTFTKEQIRQAFPGISQADRRIRDLRDFGWVMHTSSEDATLVMEEQRLVKVGVAVWNPAERRAAALKQPLQKKDRMAAMARDDFMCKVCGISASEPYLDDSNQTAMLSVVRQVTVLPDGSEETYLMTVCKRCTAGSKDHPARADEVFEQIQNLDADERRRLARWIERGRRGSTALDRAWNGYRRLPADAQDKVRAALGE